MISPSTKASPVESMLQPKEDSFYGNSQVSFDYTGGKEWDNTDVVPIRNTNVICRAVVIYDFEAAPNTMEISVNAGDEIDILEKQADGYYIISNDSYYEDGGKDL